MKKYLYVKMSVIILAVVLIGCAHPGILNIMKEINLKFPEEPILLLLGGFHLKSINDKEVFENIITGLKEYGVERVAPAHCSCEPFESYAEQYSGIEYIKGGVGLTVQF